VRDVRRRERRHPAVLDQDVVERQRALAVRRRPVVALAWRHDDGAVQAHFLSVVLADVRVVPVRAGVGHAELVGERAAHRDGRLCGVRAVEAVVEPQAVPVHRGWRIAVVGHAHPHGRALRDAQVRAGHRAIVGQQAHPVAADALAHRRDHEVMDVAVGEFDRRCGMA
jgi:hypothetical protein